MENSSSGWSHRNTTPLATQSREDEDLLRAEQTVFLSCITLLSALAIPPNLVLLHLAIRTPSSRRGKRSAHGPCRVSHLPLLLISQIVSNLLISLTSPLDVLFLAQGGQDEVECLLFLAVKSVVMLFSVLVVCLQGLDKVHRVHNLHRVVLHSMAGRKLAAITVSVIISALPLTLELALTGGQPLKDNCQVLPVVVEVTEGIFLLGFSLSCLSLIAVVAMLRRQRRQVAMVDIDTLAGPRCSSRELTSPRLLSVSGMCPENTTADNYTGRTGTVTTAVPTTSSADATTDSSSKTLTKTPVTVISQSLNHNEDKDAISSTPVVSLQRSQNLEKKQTSTRRVSGHQLTTLNCQHLQSSQASVGTSPVVISSHQSAPGVSGSVLDDRRASKTSVRWTLSTQGQLGAKRKLSSYSVTSDKASVRRSLSTSTATQRRLELAAVTAVKRGALSLVIFIVCYMPLMVALLILSLDHPVYETALLLEGLTLPISYVHVLVSPILAMRLDREWRQQAFTLLCRWFKCCGKTRPT